MSKANREQGRAERAAAIQHEQKAAERNRRILITLGIVLALSAIVAGFVIFSSGDTTKKPTESGALPPASAQGQALVVGDNAQAANKVVVHEDFLCPYCREFETSTRDFLHTAANKGTAQIEYRPFHLLQDDYSTRALSAWAAVLEKGTPEQALKYHDLLYDNQPYENAGDKPDADTLAAWAKDAGVTDSSVLDAVKTLNPTFVEAADKAAEEAGVTGTPTVTVNGKQLEGSSISEMADNLEQMLAGS